MQRRRGQSVGAVGDQRVRRALRWKPRNPATHVQRLRRLVRGQRDADRELCHRHHLLRLGPLGDDRRMQFSMRGGDSPAGPPVRVRLPSNADAVWTVQWRRGTHVVGLGGDDGLLRSVRSRRPLAGADLRRLPWLLRRRQHARRGLHWAGHSIVADLAAIGFLLRGGGYGDDVCAHVQL